MSSNGVEKFGYQTIKLMSKTYCGDCGHFLGMGDFDLCCEIHHPTPKEVELGIKYAFGFICSEDTLACDEYVPKEEKEQ